VPRVRRGRELLSALALPGEFYRELTIQDVSRITDIMLQEVASRLTEEVISLKITAIIDLGDDGEVQIRQKQVL
jgi:hypothetical protein